MDAVDKIVDIFENRLKNYTYLATENISLADLVAASIFTRYFESLFGTEWRAQHPAIVRWFNTVRASPFLKDEYKDFKFADKPLSPPQRRRKRRPQPPLRRFEEEGGSQASCYRN